MHRTGDDFEAFRRKLKAEGWFDRPWINELIRYVIPTFSLLIFGWLFLWFACGAIETIASIEMMKAQTVIGTRNLDTPDPELNVVDLVTGTRKARLDRIMREAFAAVWDAAQAKGISMRTAAFVLGCERVLLAHKLRGLYP